ncbi:MAG TPA: hypothetical protein VKZ58_02720 [Longimicrobiales bacterium]|nr:hypothetical protein [Longimicrobiales bacterium]
MTKVTRGKAPDLAFDRLEAAVVVLVPGPGLGPWLKSHPPIDGRASVGPDAVPAD